MEPGTNGSKSAEGGKTGLPLHPNAYIYLLPYNSVFMPVTETMKYLHQRNFCFTLNGTGKISAHALFSRMSS